jgi:hypothetical protein
VTLVELTDDERGAAFVPRHPEAEQRLGRWFLDAPFAAGERTWVLAKT